MRQAIWTNGRRVATRSDTGRRREQNGTIPCCCPTSCSRSSQTAERRLREATNDCRQDHHRRRGGKENAGELFPGPCRAIPRLAWPHRASPYLALPGLAQPCHAAPYVCII